MLNQILYISENLEKGLAENYKCKLSDTLGLFFCLKVPEFSIFSSSISCKKKAFISLSNGLSKAVLTATCC